MQVGLPSSKGSKLGAIAGLVTTTGTEERSTAWVLKVVIEPFESMAVLSDIRGCA